MSDQAIKWNMSIPFEKRSDYIIRFTELSFGPSSKGNLMVTVKSEVAAPDTVDMQVKGETKPVTVAGTKLNAQYYTIQVQEDGVVNAEKTENCHTRWNEFRAKLELPPETNWDNPTMEDIKSVLAYALIDNKETIQTASPTKEELAKGIKVGKPLLHPKTKQPLINNYPEIKEVFCKAELPASVAF